MYHQALTNILTEQKLISDCRYRVIKSSSLVSIHFIEVFIHPYISVFHLLVNGFCVTSFSTFLIGQREIDIDVAGKATKLNNLTSLPSFFVLHCTSFFLRKYFWALFLSFFFVNKVIPMQHCCLG